MLRVLPHDEDGEFRKVMHALEMISKLEGGDRVNFLQDGNAVIENATNTSLISSLCRRFRGDGREKTLRWLFLLTDRTRAVWESVERALGCASRRHGDIATHARQKTWRELDLLHDRTCAVLLFSRLQLLFRACQQAADGVLHGLCVTYAQDTNTLQMLNLIEKRLRSVDRCSAHEQDEDYVIVETCEEVKDDQNTNRFEPWNHVYPTM